MTQEFTFYTLFILLTLSMGVVFQFFIAKIKNLEKNQKRIVKSIEMLHRESFNARDDNKPKKRLDKPRPSRQAYNTPAKPQVLTGHLRLNYQGRSADTRAVFMLDKED